jgi:metal-dependent hydrolase (beta-lactamase superfamily II)
VEPIALAPVDAVTVTTLVDNVTDLLLVDEGPAKRFSLGQAVENMRRLEISPQDIDIIVLSHGHWDHTTGMDGLVRARHAAHVQRSRLRVGRAGERRQRRLVRLQQPRQRLDPQRRPDRAPARDQDRA